MGGLPERLYRLRKAEGLSQSALAQKAGISPSYVSRIERGDRVELSATKMARLAGVLGVTVDDLIGQPKSPNNGQAKPASFTEPPRSGTQSDDPVAVIKGYHRVATDAAEELDPENLSILTDAISNFVAEVKARETDD